MGQILVLPNEITVCLYYFILFYRHYKFDYVQTPTDDIGLHHHQEGNQPLLLLPQKWNRPYLGYNPRRDWELGEADSCANRDSEI